MKKNKHLAQLPALSLNLLFLPPPTDSELDLLAVIEESKTLEPDSESTTTFYSVTSDPESATGKVHFGLNSSHSVDEIPDSELLKNMSPKSSSPLKKFKQLFKTGQSKEYDIQPGLDITTAYVDLPKVSVNPLFHCDLEPETFDAEKCDEIIEVRANFGHELSEDEDEKDETRYFLVVIDRTFGFGMGRDWGFG